VLKQAFKLGAADFIVKPFDHNVLIETLERVLV
jgi:two-component system, chemotaxis family, chemotaxis protein CheY